MSNNKVEYGFGSFQSQDVEILIRQSKEDYRKPSLPFEHGSILVGENVSFGKEMKRKEFLLDEKWCFVNHGAFGAACRIAFETNVKWQRYLESQPLRYFDRILLPMVVDTTRELSSFVNANCTDLVLVDNATTGLNTVFKSIPFTKASTVYILSTAYGAVKKMAKEACEKSGAKYHEVEVKFPITEDEIVELVENSLPSNCTLAVFDHVTSNTGIVFPIARLVEVCHERNILVLIDGAHSLGAFDLDLTSLNADFFVSNAHKWLCSVKSAGFIFSLPQHKKLLRPSNISHGWNSGYLSEFSWTGTQSYSSILSVQAAIDFWKKIGPQAIRTYSRTLLLKAAHFLVAKWKTDTLVPLEMTNLMALVRLTDNLSFSSDPAPLLQTFLFDTYKIESPIKRINGTLYVRISCHCYNEFSDFETLGKYIPEAIAHLKIAHLNNNVYS